jgi:hypothetical protein
MMLRSESMRSFSLVGLFDLAGFCAYFAFLRAANTETTQPLAAGAVM